MYSIALSSRPQEQACKAKSPSQGVVTGSALLGKAGIPWVAQASALSLAKAKPSVSRPLGNAEKQLQIP